MAIFGLPHGTSFFVTGNLVFTIKKFINNPAAINSLTSLDVIFNLVFAATCLYISDRIWTRYGRRKVFMIPAYFMIAIAFMILPLATNIYTMILGVVLWYIFIDVAATFQTLKMELIPPHQRGRWSAMNSWLFQIAIIVFFVFLGPRFDDVLTIGNFKLTGEMFTYWFGSTMMIGGGIFLCFFIKEVKPAEEPPSFKGGFLGVYKSIFADKRLFPVYLLMFCWLMVQQGLDSLGPLLFTEQWGYTKQDMGTNFLAGGLINLFYIPILGWLVDKYDRAKLFLFALAGTMLAKIAYYVFIQFILPDSRPDIIHMIIFGQVASMLGWIIQVAFWPLVYDFIPRDKMGTAQTGISIVKTLTRLILMNGVGIWVTIYSMMFLPEGTFDYFSAYIFLIITDIIGVAIVANFIHKIKIGKLHAVGREEFHPVEEEQGTEA
jgi:Na+/melibiose symporter-like transporter